MNEIIMARITAQTDMRRLRNFAPSLRVQRDCGERVPEKKIEEVERENANKQVCLNCTKKRCSGTARCFKKERDKKNDQG